MIYQMTTVSTVVNKIIRDLGLGDEEIPFHDYIEWIGEALSHIGSYYQFEDKEELVAIDNHQGLLPCDLHKVIRIRKGCKINDECDLRSGWMSNTLQGILAACGCDFSELNSLQYYNLSLYGSTAIKPPVEGIGAINNIMSINSSLIGDISANAFSENDININLNKITTGFKQGFLAIQYKAIPLDKEGFPMIPDDQSFLDAMFWKIAMHISLRDPNALKNPQLRNFDYCKQQWERYCRQARAAANMPDVELAEEMANAWLRLIPTKSARNSNYSFIGKEETYNIKGRR